MPGSDDAVAVLSAASPPPPADPVLRILERLRNDRSPPSHQAAPPRAEREAGAAAATAGPRFAIQLVAVARREQAEQAWTRLRRENPDLLGRLRPIIAEPEPTPAGLFRLRAGPVASAEEGRSLCSSLARRGVDCIVVQGS